MKIQRNVSLKSFNTFGIDVKAKKFVSVNHIGELIAVLKNHPSDLFVLGGGSNILLTQDPQELVLHINFKGIEILSKSDNKTKIKVAAGENWHDFVSWCLDEDFGGLENLSLIPGNVGTAPLQNIGAYGSELKDCFVSCEAIHVKTLDQVTFYKKDCKFGYRTSIFKEELKHQYIITHVTFELSHSNHEIKTSYGAIENELMRLQIENPTIQQVSQAVINIRQSKLPDPKQIGNSGSFFKNPIISSSDYDMLVDKFGTVPQYKVSDNEIKIPAGWLIETAGFKGKTFGNYGVHDQQALVLVNHGGASGSDIYQLSKLIQSTILQLFDIQLEAEVNIL